MCDLVSSQDRFSLKVFKQKSTKCPARNCDQMFAHQLEWSLCLVVVFKMTNIYVFLFLFIITIFLIMTFLLDLFTLRLACSWFTHSPTMLPTIFYFDFLFVYLITHSVHLFVCPDCLWSYICILIANFPPCLISFYTKILKLSGDHWVKTL